MNIFYIAPWSIADPLCLTTVLPHIAVLASDERVDCITLFTYENNLQEYKINNDLLPPGVNHEPLHKAFRHSIPLVNRIRHHQSVTKKVIASGLLLHPDLIICRGTSGILGELIWRQLAIPYVVESFEPHAYYMLQTGTWRWWNLKYLVQRRWEERIKKTAAYLITVSQGYAKYLEVSEGIVSNRLRTVPCWVDSDRFVIDTEKRLHIREKLCIGNCLAVVYAGKFSGIYAPLHELMMLHHLQQGLGQPIFVIVLTSADRFDVLKQLHLSGFRDDQVFVDCVPHEDVNGYLNAADIAISFWSSGPWSFACSPIKHAEYWACGLPLLMSPLVGDEAHWLENEEAGATAIFSDSKSVEAAAHRLKSILGDVGHRERIRRIALNRRGPNLLQQVYDELLDVFDQ